MGKVEEVLDIHGKDPKKKLLQFGLIRERINSEDEGHKQMIQEKNANLIKAVERSFESKSNSSFDSFDKIIQAQISGLLVDRNRDSSLEPLEYYLTKIDEESLGKLSNNSDHKMQEE